MLVMTGPGAGPGTQVTLGGTTLHIKFLTQGQQPAPRVEGDQVVVGRKTVSMKDGNLELGKTVLLRRT